MTCKMTPSLRIAHPKADERRERRKKGGEGEGTEKKGGNEGGGGGGGEGGKKIAAISGPNGGRPAVKTAPIKEAMLSVR